MNNIGKQCAGKSHARFDEGGLAKAATARLLRHCQTKGAETDMPNLRSQQPALYSTQRLTISTPSTFFVLVRKKYLDKPIVDVYRFGIQKEYNTKGEGKWQKQQ